MIAVLISKAHVLYSLINKFSLFGICSGGLIEGLFNLCIQIVFFFRNQESPGKCGLQEVENYLNFQVIEKYVLTIYYLSNFVVCRHSFTEDHYVEFSKHSQDRVIGTKGDIAHVSI
jgi:hypothetical protein